MTTLLDNDLTYAYCPIVKMEKTADGLMVWGQAAGTGLDLDLQRFDKEYLKRAVPDWFKWANVREQHTNIAAGVGKELEITADGESYMLKALVVDPVTIKKVETGVLKGFSPGIKRGKVVKSASAPNGLIVAGDMVEISLVDRPSDPVNKISICKAAGSGVLVPVDEDGHELPILKWLTPDLYKSAQDTVEDVLSGEYVDADQQDAAPVIGELADLLIAEAMMLKSADLTVSHDISGIIAATNALEMFLDDGEVEAFEKFGQPDLVKRFFSTDQRSKLAAEGHAMPGGEYPIENAGDLENAIRLAGRGTAPQSAIRAHIIAEAKRLGREDLIPEEWESGNDADEDDKVGATEKMVKAAVAEVTKAYEARLEALMQEVAQVKATPIPGGPVVVAPRNSLPLLTKTSEADRLFAEAKRPGLDPSIAGLMLKAAEEKGAIAS